MELLRELARLIADRAPPTPTGTWQSDSLRIRFGTATQVSAPTRSVYGPVFALVVQGEKQLVLGDQVFSSGKGTFVVVSVDLPLTFQISRASREEPYLVFAMSLDPASIAALLLETTVADGPAFESEVAGMGVSDAPSELLEAVVRLVRLLDHPRDLPVLGPMALREILWRLLCSEQGHRVRQIGLAESHLSQIARAMRFLREHYRESVPIDELAHLAGMSVTSFHRHFRAVALMSPLQYLKQIRLQEGRARLLANAADVAAVGYAVGYDSPSQFSREYKRAYGAPPAQDARLLRASNSKA